MSTDDPQHQAVGDLVTRLRERGMPSARNLLVTVFGDAVAPVDVAVPVQALVRLLEDVGASDRLVRTSLSRLVRDGLLRNEKVGRRSIYSIDPAARSLFERAEERIYHHREPEWDGRWTFAVVDANASSAAERTALRRELSWLGMGTIAPNVLASPSVDPSRITSLLEGIGGGHPVLVTRGAAVDGTSTMSDDEIARRCAPTDELSQRYAEIVDWFEPVAAAIGEATWLAPRDAWTVRLLLVATFRRVVLQDPSLPARLLPEPWVGASARRLVASLYSVVHRPAEEWLASVCSDPISAWPSGVDRGTRFAATRRPDP